MSAPEKKRGNSEGKPAGVGGLMTDVQGGGGGRATQKKAQKAQMKEGLPAKRSF